jgi:hypothetical protein
MGKMNARAIATTTSVLLLLLVVVVVIAYRHLRTGTVKVVGRAQLSRQPGIVDYFASFSDLDREARKSCGSLEAYLAAVVERPPAEIMRKLRQDAAAAAQILLVRQEETLAARLRAMMPWKVAVLRNEAENSWPHTHGDVVCLPLSHFERDDANRVETLIHELIHVYQRADPEGTRRLLERRGYELADDRVPDFVAYGARKNPDLAHIWRRRSDGTTAVTLFTTTRPADMGRTRLAIYDNAWREVEQAGWVHEHPYEEMAYQDAARLASTELFKKAPAKHQTN